MTREIKFRAFDKEHEEFVIRITGHVADLTINDLQNKRNINCDDYEFSQFTGLKDKDGTDIYEGDILAYVKENSTYMGAMGHVVFEDGAFRVKRKKTREKDVPDYLRAYTKRHRVIGDIYTTPELLTNEERHTL